jgi:hypothetical protein
MWSKTKKDRTVVLMHSGPNSSEMDFPDEVHEPGSRATWGEIVTKPPVQPPRIDPPRSEQAKSSDDRTRELLRQRLMDMIRRNEEIRRDKPR